MTPPQIAERNAIEFWSAHGGLEEVAWSFLTNHALVLLSISHRPDSTGLEIAQAVGITERAARKIIADLQVAGYIEAERVSRRNRYRVDSRRPVGHIGERDLTVADLIGLVGSGERQDSSVSPRTDSLVHGHRS